MAVEAGLSVFRGEKLTISWSSPDHDLDITGRPLTFRLLASRGGAVLASLTPGSGVTITGARAATIVVPGSATDLEPGEYYFSVGDTGVPVLYTHGSFTISPPSAP